MTWYELGAKGRAGQAVVLVSHRLRVEQRGQFAPTSGAQGVAGSIGREAGRQGGRECVAWCRMVVRWVFGVGVVMAA